MRLPVETQREDEEQVLPLINIAFLLLIFFVLVGTLEAPDGIPIKPARSITDQPLTNQGPLILVSSDGRITIDGESVRLEELGMLIESVVAVGGLIDLRVKPDAELEAQKLVEILTQLRVAGAQGVRLLTLPIAR